MNLGSQIGFNKSSLLSLKAELARKHEEASQVKANSRTKPSKLLAKPPKSARSKSGVNVEDIEEDKSFDDPPEANQLHSSRLALERKAKLYEKLSENPGYSKEDVPFLVDFSRKTEAAPKPQASNEEEDEDAKRVETDSDEYDAPSDPEDDWVEYTDCLGRTRRCLRRDLAELKTQDAQLYESTKRDSPPPPPPPSENPSSVPVGCAAPDLFSDDMSREQQRQKWAEEEEHMRNKPDVHYQDVLFNEARQHGVGYFAFSTDEAERRAQQTALKNLRSETEKQQVATTAARNRRADLLNKRLRAAHNRKRAREGLPPLADDEELPGKERPESPTPEPEPPQIQLAADPDRRGQRAPPAPSVRPWDIGKEGVTERPVMTQDEWVSEKRKDRHREFAPPSFYEDRRPSEAFRTNPSSSHSETFEEYEEPKGLYFSTKRKKKNREEPNRKPMKEVEDFTGEDFTGEDLSSIPIPEPKKARKGAEIPPPPTMEYFGPSDKTMESSKRHGIASTRLTTEDLENSISAGLSFLRKQHEEKEKQREKGMLDIL